MNNITPQQSTLSPQLPTSYTNYPLLNICYNYNPPQTFVNSYTQNTQTDNNYDYGLLYEAHLNMLNEIKDKSLVLSVLCSKSCTLFSRIRMFINIPLILSSGAMTILNSMNDTDTDSIKYANIVINSCTVTILSLVSNFKLAEREITYRQTHIKMKKLYHQVDIILRTEPMKINDEYVGKFTKEYVNIYEHLEYPIPYYVRRQFNKDLISVAVDKKKSEEHTKQTKQKKQDTKKKSYKQKKQTIPNDYNCVVFNDNLTFAAKIMNEDFSQISEESDELQSYESLNGSQITEKQNTV